MSRLICCSPGRRVDILLASQETFFPPAARSSWLMDIHHVLYTISTLLLYDFLMNKKNSMIGLAYFYSRSSNPLIMQFREHCWRGENEVCLYEPDRLHQRATDLDESGDGLLTPNNEINHPYTVGVLYG